jgi:hypothetical protein
LLPTILQFEIDGIKRTIPSKVGPQQPKRPLKGNESMTRKNIRYIFTTVLVCASLATFTAQANTQQTIGITRAEGDWIIVGIAASGAAIGVGIFYLVRHDHTVTGCAFSGERGLQLQSEGDQQTYSLVGEVAEIKPGERVRISGKKQKKNPAPPRQFLVEKFKEDLGACTIAPPTP